MNTNRLITLPALGAVLLAACAPAATATQPPRIIAAGPTQAPQATQVVISTQVVEQQIAAATQAPAYSPLPLLTATPAGLWPQPTPVDMFFEDYGVNPFVDTAEDHLSTFALDVDTASYSLARRYLNDGLLPPADAIRVEEFVNYFEQDYPIPPDVAFGLFADGAPSPFQLDGTYLLRVGVQGYEVPAAQRQTASLTFVIDVSGSMASENRLELVKQSLQMLVDRLRPDDTVAIVVYGSDARAILNPTSGEDRASILSAIYGLAPEGATNAEAGLTLGYQMAALAYRPGAINRVILCSDGVANVGATGPQAILESIGRYAHDGIELTTVGFGMGNFNDVLMEQLADQGDGHYAYVDTLDEAAKLFVEDLTSTLQVIALDAKVQVDFNPEVVGRYRLIGYENRAVADENFRNDAVDAGEIGAGHTATALYAVQLRGGAQGRLATVQLRWEDPLTHRVAEINGNLNTWDLAQSFDEASPRYQLAVTVAQFAERLRGSPWAAGTSYEQLAGYAARVAGLLPGDAEVLEFAELVWRTEQLWG
jgi:Ca-activated chloride channel family protein